MEEEDRERDERIRQKWGIHIGSKRNKGDHTSSQKAKTTHRKLNVAPTCGTQTKSSV